jgi:hypothetical protein
MYQTYRNGLNWRKHKKFVNKLDKCLTEEVRAEINREICKEIMKIAVQEMEQ